MAPNVNNFSSKEFFKKNKSEYLKKIFEYQSFIRKNFEYVGKDFSRKVREVFYDKKSKKAIYGTTTPDERKELAEEGIDLVSIPWINKDN